MHRRILSVLVIGFAAAAPGATAQTLPPPSASPTPTVLENRIDTAGNTQIEAHFAEPNRRPRAPEGFVDPTVKDRLIRLIDDVPDAKGQRISIAFHSLDRVDVVDALVRAQAAGIKVLVVFDGRKGNATSDSLRSRLATANGTAANDSTTRGEFHYCNNGGMGTGSCISANTAMGGGDQHAKYALFSSTRNRDGALREHAAWISSANMTTNTGVETYNNGVVVYGATSFYNELRTRIFNRALARDWMGFDYLNLSPDTETRGYAVGETANAHAWASPDGGNEDPVLRQLDKYKAAPGCSVQVMQAIFGGDRPQAIAQRLRDLATPGGAFGSAECSVRVLVGTVVDPVTGARVANIGDEVRRILCPATNPYPIRVRSYARLHDKVMLMNAPYGEGSSFSKVVYAGSHNFTDQAWTVNDELLLKVGMMPDGSGLGIFNAFRQHFVNAWEAGGAQAGADVSQPLPPRSGFPPCPG